jgi:hypothetical protein
MGKPSRLKNFFDLNNVFIFVVFFIFAALIFSLFKWVPIHPDEINTRIINSRFFIDGLKYYGFQFPCSLNPVKIPIILYPEAALGSIFSLITNTSLLRLFPFLSYALFSASLAFAVYKYYKLPTFYSLLIGSALFFLSFSNASSIWNVTQRIENLLFLVFSFFILLGAVYDSKTKNLLVMRLALFVSILFWLSICIAHPKALYFCLLPLGLVFIYFDRIFFKLLILFVISISLFEIVDISFIRFFKCETNTQLQDMYAGFNVNILQLFSSPEKYYLDFRKYWEIHWLNLFHRAPNNLSYIANPDIGHVPAADSLGYFVNLTNFFIRTNFFFNLHIFLMCLIYVTFKFTKNLHNNIYKRDIYLIFSLSIPLFLMITHNRTLNSYDIQFWSVLMNFINIVFFLHILSKRNNFKKIYILCYFYFIISTIFLSYNLVTYYKKFYRVYTSSWNSGHFAGPGVPINYLSKDNINQIQLDFQSCTEQLNPEIIFIDDRSYIPLEKISPVFPITYTMLALYHGRSKEEGLGQFNLFLSRYRDPIFYGACEFLPELPSSFYIKDKYGSTGLCCFVSKNFNETNHNN